MDERKPNIRTSEKVLQSVVKLFVQLSTPNYSMPWQMKRQQQVFGSGFVISGRRILTNGHVVAYQKSVRVRKHGDAKKYNAHVIHVGHECDIAMLGVSDEKFWENLDPLEFGDIPKLEEDVVCVGFPTGGDNISVTRGVVSRVEIQRYAHSAVELLAIQIDAAINSGNSGGPALQDDKLIGIAFETLDNAENIGYIIPYQNLTPKWCSRHITYPGLVGQVINHFLEDIERNGTYYGFCRLGIKWQPIESEHMRSYFKLSVEQTGVLVTKVLPLFTSDGVLKRGDVLMAVDDETIADNGTVHFRGNERILFDYALSHKYVGDTCKVQILRQGEVMQVEVKMSLVTSLVPTQLYDKRPSYLVFAGLVFVTLSQPYMQHQYGKDWARKAPIRLCDRVLYGILEKPGQEVILLSQILASELTTGYENMSNLQLFKVNGIPVLNLKHLAVLLDEIVKPHVKNNKMEVASPSKDSDVAMTTDCQDDEGSVKNASNNERTQEEKYTSFKVFDEEARTGKRSSSTAESRTDSSQDDRTGPVASHTVAQGNCSVSPKQVPPSTPKGYLFNPSEANPLDGVYTGLKDDPTLLNGKDYLHFELDKDKVVVLQIASAYKASDEILKQYAIGTPRSDDLPPSP